MEAIYQALLLLESSPVKATTMLTSLSHNNPHFLLMLKDMCLQLRQRFGPEKQQNQLQFQSMSKTMLVIFNRMLKQDFLHLGNNAYKHLEEYYQWMLEILACPSISFVHKNILQPTLTLILNHLAHPRQRFLQFHDKITQKDIDQSACLFIYLQAMLKSKINQDELISTIKESHQFLFFICNHSLNYTIDFYRQRYMQMDDPNPFSPFVMLLKQVQYMLTTLCDMISFCFYYYNQRVRTHVDLLTEQMLFSQELGIYLKRILNLERQLFRSNRQSNKHGLQLIIMGNFTANQCKIINKIKTMCLTSISLIISVTDKKFNLTYTDKPLLRSLEELTVVLISDLEICSQPHVMTELSQELWADSMLSAMVDVLKTTCMFVDLQKIFHRMLDVRGLIQLTFGFLLTYQEELTLFEHEHEDYFALTYYILFGKIDEKDEIESHSIDLTLGEFCLKRHIVDFIKNMCIYVEGFASTMLELCLDVALLETTFRKTKNHDLKQMFKAKHHLQRGEGLELINLESAILMLTVVIEGYDNKLSKSAKFKQFLDTINPSSMTQLQLTRTYTFLSVHSVQFKSSNIYTKHYHWIERALSMNKNDDSLNNSALYFLRRVIVEGYEHTKSYCSLADKVLSDALEHVVSANSALFVEFIVHTVQSDKIRRKILNFEWINKAVELTTMLAHRVFSQKKSNHDLILAILKLYTATIDAAHILTQNNQQHPYPSFKQQAHHFDGLINNTLHQKLITFYSKIFKAKDLIKQEYHCIYQLADYLFVLFVRDAKLDNTTFAVVIDLIMGILSRDEKQNHSYTTAQFKLLYQLINRVPYQLQESHYLTIRNWMQSQLHSFSQLHINQVCLIMQLIYFFIHGNIFQKSNMITFFQPVTAQIQKIFIKQLLTYEEYCSVIQQEEDADRRKINLSNLHHDPYNKEEQKNPITIVRLYNTIILNPNHQPQSIHLVKKLLKFYIRDQLPYYDLAVQFLAISILVARTRNSGVLEIFTMGLDMLYCNAIYQRDIKNLTIDQRVIKDLTKELRSPISILDPYAQLANMVNEELNKPRRPIFIDYRLPFEQIEVNIIDFIKNDESTLNTVKKLISIRRINDQPRKIVKIKRDQE